MPENIKSVKREKNRERNSKRVLVCSITCNELDEGSLLSSVIAFKYFPEPFDNGICLLVVVIFCVFFEINHLIDIAKIC